MLTGMRIAILCSAFEPYIKGGGEVSTKELAVTLIEGGADIHVFTVFEEQKEEIVNDLPVTRVKHANYYWSYTPKGGSFTKLLWHMKDADNNDMAIRMMSFLKQYRPDIVITSTIEDISSSIWRLVSKENIPIIHILRSYSLLCPKATMFKNNKSCLAQCLSCHAITTRKKTNSNYVDAVVGISNYILDVHRTHGYFKNSLGATIYNVVDDMGRGNKSERYLWEPVKAKKVVLGFLGNILPTKGLDMLVEAVGNCEYTKYIELKVGGDGDVAFKNKVLDLASRQGVNINFLGRVQPKEFFESVDWLVVPSLWHEPFGRIVAESIYFNTPVIVSSVGGMPELVKEDNGYIYCSGKELENCLNRVFSSKKKLSFRNKDAFSRGKIAQEWSYLFEMLDGQ